MARISLSKHCLGGQPGSHSTCPKTTPRPRMGILAGILYIHHPQPDPGQSLTHHDVPCGCPCHRTTKQPTTGNTTTD